MTARVLAILAAIFLVMAFAAATLGPLDTSLGELLHGFDARLLSGVQRALSPWLWQNVAVPLLMRPAWLIPAGLGLLCAGGAATAAGAQGRSPRRWRS